MKSPALNTNQSDTSCFADLDPEGKWITVNGNHVHINRHGFIDAGGPPAVRELLEPGKASKGKPESLKVSSQAPKPYGGGFRQDSKIPQLDKLSFKKQLGGSTGAKLMTDPDGNKFVVKKGGNEGHLREEDNADRIYRAIGIPVPDSKIYETANGPVKVSKFLEEAKPLGEVLENADSKTKKSLLEQARKGFAADALLGNWDVVGMEYDNMMVAKDGTVVRIDNGGSLRYRAMGKQKNPDAWTNKVGELDSMRHGKGSASAQAIMGELTEDEVRKQVTDLLPHRKAILKAAPEDLRKILDERLDDMAARFGIEAKYKPKPPTAKEKEYLSKDLHASGEWPKLKPLPGYKMPDGTEVPPKKARSSYGGVIFNDEGKVLLREPAGHYDGYHWTFPKGGGDKGEHPLDSAKREVAEETGHHGEVFGHVPGVHSSNPASGSYFYMMKSAGENPHLMDKETKSTRWASLDEARELIKQSKNKGGRERDLGILEAAYKAYHAHKQGDKVGMSQRQKYLSEKVWFNAETITRKELKSQLRSAGHKASLITFILDSAEPAR